MIGARFVVQRGGVATVLRPLPDGDEGLFAAEPSGSIQLGRVSEAASAILGEEAVVRIYVVPASEGPQRFCPSGAVVLTPDEHALGIFLPNRRAKARAVEILRAARDAPAPTLDERMRAIRRDLRALPGADPAQVQEAVQLLERAWLAAKRAAGEISIDDPPEAPSSEPAPPEGGTIAAATREAGSR
jgi:hypothetical protein